MKRILIYIVIIGLGFGCEEKLDIKNPNEPSVQYFWQNEEDAVKGVNAVYSTLHKGSISRWMPMLFSTRSDIGQSRSPWTDLANALDKFIQPDYNFYIRIHFHYL